MAKKAIRHRVARSILAGVLLTAMGSAACGQEIDRLFTARQDAIAFPVGQTQPHLFRNVEATVRHGQRDRQTGRKTELPRLDRREDLKAHLVQLAGNGRRIVDLPVGSLHPAAMDYFSGGGTIAGALHLCLLEGCAGVPPGAE